MATALELFYVVSSILIGSVIITYLLKFVTIDATPKIIRTAGVKVLERALDMISVSDPLVPPTIPANKSTRGYLETLPQRRGTRPAVEGFSSPIQRTQLPPWEEKNVQDRLRSLIIEIPEKYSQSTYLGRSTFEPSLPTTLFARHRIFDKTKYLGEIISANAEDGFVHSTLHSSDVKTVIEKGWGQRHPLSGRLTSRLTGLVDSNQPSPVAGSKVLLYAPRDDNDLEIMKHIINAAVWWVGGINSRMDDEKLLGGDEW